VTASGTGTRPQRRPLLIGLTGPIGCGKSTVARMLGDCGGTVIDADELARRATEPDHPTLPRIRERFGDDVFDTTGTLDRAALARVVFADSEALAALEQIIHPEVRRMLEAELESATAAEAPFVVVEAIKLVEGGLAERCDEVWLVDCPPGVQRERLIARGATVDDVERRLATQGPDLVQRLERALRQTEGDVAGRRVRRVSTAAAADETRALVEDALADAFEADSDAR
jgi:dephospho-CoA kinase